MAWTQAFNSVRDEELVVNLLAVIARDFKLALDVLYTGESLSDFKETSLGRVRKLEFPCLAIGPKSNASSPSEDGGYLTQGFRVEIFVGVTDDSDEHVTNRVMKYMTTMGEVLRVASKNDMFLGMEAETFGYVFESEWEYGPIGESASSLFRSALMTVTITVNAR